MSGVFTFGTPCLRSKQIGYIISQNGVPSFIAPYFGRYLTITCEWTRDDSALLTGGLDGQGTVISGSITQNYYSPSTGPAGPAIYTGNTTPNCPVQFYYPFYGSTPPTGDPNQQWDVADDTYTSVIKYYYEPGYGPRVVTSKVTLTNEYTLGQLQTDGDNQLAAWLAANGGVDSVGWGDTLIVPFGEFPQPDIITSLSDYNPDPNEFVAAWSGMGYVTIGTAGTYYPNAFVKVTGYVRMAGLYRQRRYYINFDPTHTIPSDGGIDCVSATGSCGSQFLVVPPGPNPIQNAFVTITPNRQCP